MLLFLNILFIKEPLKKEMYNFHKNIKQHNNF